MTARTWTPGDRQPSNDDVRQVRGNSGTIYQRSKPAGLHWYPRGGGLIELWDELLLKDGPVVEDGTAFPPLTLFDLQEAS